MSAASTMDVWTRVFQDATRLPTALCAMVQDYAASFQEEFSGLCTDSACPALSICAFTSIDRTALAVWTSPLLSASKREEGEEAVAQYTHYIKWDAEHCGLYIHLQNNGREYSFNKPYYSEHHRLLAFTEFSSILHNEKSKDLLIVSSRYWKNVYSFSHRILGNALLAAFSPDRDHLLVATDKKRIVIISLITMSIVDKINCYTSYDVTALHVGAHERGMYVIAGFGDGAIKIWSGFPMGEESSLFPKAGKTSRPCTIL